MNIQEKLKLLEEAKGTPAEKEIALDIIDSAPLSTNKYNAAVKGEKNVSVAQNKTYTFISVTMFFDKESK